MRPTHITPGHRGIPSTEGYSQDVTGIRQWCQDVSAHARRERGDLERSGAFRLSPLQRLALRTFGLWPWVRAMEDAAHATGRAYVANTAAALLTPTPAPKGWGSTD